MYARHFIRLVNSSEQYSQRLLRVRYMTISSFVIREMFLFQNKISSVGMAALSLGKWDNLEYLYLGNNQIESWGCRHLSKTIFNSLRNFHLNYNQIEGPGILHLSKAQWRHLQKIWLAQNRLSVDGPKYLVKANWDQLSKIHLYECGLTYSNIIPLILLQADAKIINLFGNLRRALQQQTMKRQMKQKFSNCNFFIAQ